MISRFRFVQTDRTKTRNKSSCLWSQRQTNNISNCRFQNCHMMTTPSFCRHLLCCLSSAHAVNLFACMITQQTIALNSEALANVYFHNISQQERSNEDLRCSKFAFFGIFLLVWFLIY